MCPQDVIRLKAALDEFQDAPAPISPSESLAPAVRVIECVLSLRNRFHSMVVPRVNAFACDYPQIRSCRDLISAITAAGGPHAFIRQRLRYDYADRGQTLLGVAQYLDTQQARFVASTEVGRLGLWANSVAPEDYRKVGVCGFGLAGFQYIRMLFGADTTKPDVHIVRYVSAAVGRRVSAITALHLLAGVNALTGVRVRTYDALIWNKGERGSRAKRSHRACTPCTADGMSS